MSKTTTNKKQVAANRANSARSTGPTSIAGKAASSQNATSHGLCAAVLAVFNWESEEQLKQLRDDYLTRFRPADRVERDLVDRLVDSTWRNRILSIETALLELEIERTDATVTGAYNESESGLLRLALAFRERNGDRVWTPSAAMSPRPNAPTTGPCANWRPCKATVST